MSTRARLVRSERGAVGAEFALVLPLLLLFLFGIIDAGRFMWEYNQAEKATQMGVRYAVVTDPALSGPVRLQLCGQRRSAGRDRRTDQLGIRNGMVRHGYVHERKLHLHRRQRILRRDRTQQPGIHQCSDPDGGRCIHRSQAANVQIEYKNAGIGFAGNPDGPDVSPLVTVKLRSLTFRPITCMVFRCSISMPDFAATLTLEDASGNAIELRIDAVSVINPNETARNWQASKRESAVQLYLSGVEGDSADARRHPRRGFPAQPQHRPGHRLDRPGGIVRRGRGDRPGRCRRRRRRSSASRSSPRRSHAADRGGLRTAAGAGPLAGPRRRA